MSCTQCMVLKQTIRSPRQLSLAIFQIARQLKDNHLLYLGAGPWGKPFEKICEGKNWGEYVNNYFECSHCHQIIHLYAETTSGQGGQVAFLLEVKATLLK
ncbi:hypothetical protein VST7929_01378 [Vibrio stylophorae]|uniref:Uncharacterized protein n=1 Tax=Vibrio stylophorae TaxID=659351 RepID=A0ABN8DT45_9VIBR|nr:hypothetical protein [Vibrio stylophorae]CAH0533508.1 hypothetical protein VST7929_01378 [Vibrio stylophorae]